MQHIYVVGDSISMHYGPFLARDLQGVMTYARKTEAEEAALKLDPPHTANGLDSDRVRAFLHARAEAGGLDADLLLVNCGLHDIKTDPATGVKPVPLNRYRDNLRALVALAAPLGVTLVWMRTTPCDEAVHNRADMAFHRFAADVVAYNRAADAIMVELGVPEIDLYTLTQNLGLRGEALYADHVHFPEHVREKQAAFIAGWLAAWAQRLA